MQLLAGGCTLQPLYAGGAAGPVAASLRGGHAILTVLPGLPD